MADDSKRNSGDAHREQLLEAVIADYIRAGEAGRPPDRREILAAHPELAAELMQFFAQRDRMNQWVDPTLGWADGLFQSVGPGQQISYVGNYELLEEVARGGMGVVYKARQATLGRIVAVKMIVAGRLATDDDVKRFQVEAQAAAGLQHPNIVPIHEVGQHEGLHYFSMDFVEGRSLAAILRENLLPAKQAAAYVRQMAEAIHYAHQQGTLHRDLKPSNVLIDSRDQVRITDFGLAMRVEGDSDLTRTGQILGTPSYMPPEQARGQRNLIGPGSDVYSLGAILYECLTGRAPFRGDSVLKTIEQVLRAEAASPRLLNPGAPRDLETICLKCLEKEPHRRYGTAQLLADDLQRYLDGRPILARPAGSVERTWRWCRRNPLLASAFATATILLVGASVASSIAAARNADLAKRTIELSKLKEQQLQDSNAAATRERGLKVEAIKSEQLAKDSQQETRQLLYTAEMNLASQEARTSTGGRIINDLLQSWVPVKGAPDHRHWEWYYLNGLLHGADLTCSEHASWVGSVSFSPDGNVAVSTGNKSRIWNVETGLTIFEADAGGWVRWSPASQQFAVCKGKVIQIQNGTRDSLEANLQSDVNLSAFCWSPDGTQIVANDINGRLLLWKVSSPTPRVLFDSGGPTKYWTVPAWSGDGSMIAIASHGANGVWIVDVATGQPIVIPMVNQIRPIAVCWSPNDRLLAVADAVHISVRIIDVSNAAAAQTTVKFSPSTIGAIRAMSWHPSGSHLALAGDNGSFQLLPLDATGTDRIVRAHLGKIADLCWQHNGQRLLTVGDDQLVRVWTDPLNKAKYSGSGQLSSPRAAGWSPSGDEFACLQNQAKIVVHDSETNAEKRQLNLPASPDSPFSALAWQPTASRIAVCRKDLSIELINSETGKADGTLRMTSELAAKSTSGNLAVAWSPDGRWLAARNDVLVAIWDTHSQELVATSKPGTTFCLSWSSDSRRLAFGDNYFVKVWDRDTHESITPQRPPNYQEGEVCFAAEFSPNGRWLAYAGAKGMVRLFNARTLRHERDLLGHSGTIHGISWSRDGRRIASVANDAVVRLYDVDSGRQVASLPVPEPQVSIQFSPDGCRLLLTSEKKKALVLDASRGFVAAQHPDALPLLSRRIQSNPLDAESLKARSQILSKIGRQAEADADTQILQQLYRALKPPDREQENSEQNERKATDIAEREPSVREKTVAAAIEDRKRRRYIADMQLAQSAWETGHVAQVRYLLEQHGPGSASEDLRGFEWFYWHRLARSTKTENASDAVIRSEPVTFKGHPKEVWSAAFSPDGARIASGSFDQTVKLWDAATTQEILTTKKHSNLVMGVVFSPDGTRIASLDSNEVKLWDAVMGEETMSLKGHTSLIRGVAFSPNGAQIASGGFDQTVRLWNVATGEMTATLKGHTKAVVGVAFNSDGTKVASGSFDKTVRVWDAATGQQLLTLAGHTKEVANVAFSPDGARIASASWDSSVKVWDSSTGRETLTLIGHKGGVYSVAFSPDGARIVSIGYDNMVKIWDTVTGQETLTLKGHTQKGTSVVFSPDGTRIASASYDGTVKIWGGTPPAETPPRDSLKKEN